MSGLVLPAANAADGDTVTITVKTAGLRTGPNAIADGPAGAVYTATKYYGKDVPVPEDALRFSCTVVAGSGDCVIDVPMGHNWLISQTSAPEGWYNTANRGISIANGPEASTQTYEFLTGQVGSNATVNANLNVPANPGSMQAGDIRFTKFENGAWVARTNFYGRMLSSLNNPKAPEQCSTNVAFVLDQSYSMTKTFLGGDATEADISKQQAMKNAASTAIKALKDTTSTVAAYSFSGDVIANDTTVNPQQISRLESSPTKTGDDQAKLLDFIDNLPTIKAAATTNWDTGLYQVVTDPAADKKPYDLVLMLTDGNPTKNGTSQGVGDRTYAKYVDLGIASANAIKNLGTRVVAVGMGIQESNVNLSAISGPVAASESGVASESDYFDIQDPEQLTKALTSLVTGGCSSELTIQKQILDTNDQVIADSALSNDWEFSNTVSDSAATVESPVTTANMADKGGNGFAVAALEIPGLSTTDITVQETLQPGYTAVSAQCKVNGVDVATTFDNGKATFAANPGSAHSCLFTNKMQPATLQLKKVVVGAAGTANTNWVLNGTGAGSATVTNAAGGDTEVVNVNPGVEYSLSEAAKADFANAAEFSAGAWSCVDGSGTVDVVQGAAGAATLGALTAGQNVVCTVTNTHVDQGVDVAKTVTSNVQNADGTWTTTYEVTATNKSAVVSADYNLEDELKFGAGITVNSAAWTGPGAAAGTWTAPMTTPKTVLASNAVVAAGATDTYTVTVNSTVTQAAWDDNTTVCNPDQNTKGGFLNSATLTHDGVPTTATACDTPGLPTIEKSVVGEPVWEATTGHWTITYSLTVTNPSDKTLTYDLEDVTAFASGISVFSSSATKGAVPMAAWDVSKPLATGTSIAAGAQDIYTVTVAADVSGVTKDSDLVCAGSGTGFYNQAILNSGTIEMVDDACTPPTPPTFVPTKSVIEDSAKQAADGTWGLDYLVTVQNTGTVGGVYNLDDTLRFGTGMVAGSASWTGSNGTNGSWANPSTTPKAVLARKAPLGAGLIDTYTVSVRGINIAEGVIDSAAGVCPADGKDAGAFNNAAILTAAGATTEVTACDEPSIPEFAKTAVSAIQNVGVPTEWALSYKLTADNSSNTLANFYTLFDEPDLAAGVDIVGVTVGGVPVTMVDGKLAVVDTPTEIAGGATVSYDLVMTVNIPGNTDDLPTCGLLNRAVLVVGSDSIADTACLEPKDVPPTVTKTVTSNTQNVNGTWDIEYAVTVTQPALGAANPEGRSSIYSLDDELKFGAGITVNSASWTGATAGTWADPMTTAKTTFATDRVIAAGVTDTYTVTVNATATQDAFTNKTVACPADKTKGGFLNSATMTVKGDPTTVTACDTPGMPTIEKSVVGEPVWDATTGHWTITYDLTVTNPSVKTLVYDLEDKPAFASGISVVSSSAAKNDAPIAGWDGSALLATETSIAAGVKDVYRVTVVADVSVVSGVSKLECATSGSASGTGFYNQAILTSGTIPQDAEACGNPKLPKFDIAKSVVDGSMKQAADGTWGVDYLVTVTNTSEVNGLYDLADTLRFGAGITVGSASWTGPNASSGDWVTPSTTPATVLATNAALDAGLTDSYTVSVRGIVVPKGVIGAVAGLCPADGKDPGSLNNAAIVTFAGETKEATVCPPLTTPEIFKTAISAVPNVAVPHEWTVTYQLTVDNSANTATNFYTLDDEPKFIAGTSIAGVTVDGVPVTMADGKVTVVGTPTAIAGGATAGYAVVFTVNVAGDTKALAKCVTADGGLNNQAQLTVGADTKTAEACTDLGDASPVIAKSVSASTQNADGTWTIDYAVTVAQPEKGEANPFGSSALYNLDDELKFGAGITVNSASWAGPVASAATWANPMETPKTVLATDVVIVAGVTDTYTVSVNASVTPAAWADGTTVCVPDGKTKGGSLNSAILTVDGVRSEATACAEPPVTTFVHTKSVLAGSVKQAADGTWALDYLLTVKNTGTVAGLYSLADTLRFGKGMTVGSASWTGPNASSGIWPNPSPTAVLATDAQLAPGATHTYTVSVSQVSVPKGVIGTEAGLCPADETKAGAFNNAAGLTVAGVTTEVTACDLPTTPEIVKTAISAVPNVAVPGQWTVSYQLTVDNSAHTNTNVFTLVDQPKFVTGTEIVSVMVDGVPATMTDGKLTVVGTPTTIAGGANANYAVEFTVNIAGDSKALAKCVTADGGLNNQAQLTVGAVTKTDEACLDPEDILPTIAKTVTSNTQNADGTWTTEYAVTVTQPAKGITNPFGNSANYDLADELKFGAGITVNSASWNGPTAGAWGNPVTTPKTVLATAAVIAAGVTDTYTVNVNSTVTQTAVDQASLVCKSDDTQAGGFLNAAVLTVGGHDLDAQDCAEPAVPTVGKKLLASTRNADGTWSVDYLLEAKNASTRTAALFELTDTTPQLPKGVSATGDWTAVAVGEGTPVAQTASWASGTTATIASGLIPAGTVYSYQVSIVLDVLKASTPETCNGVSGILILNKGDVTSGGLISHAEDCGLVAYYDMGIVKTHKSISGNAVVSGSGKTIEYRLVVTNHGEQDTLGVVVNDPMPAGLTVKIDSLSSNKDWDFSGTTATLLNAKYIGADGVFAAGMETTIKVPTTVGELPKNATDDSYLDITNIACVSNSKPDSNPDNDCSTDTVKAKAPSKLAHTGMSNEMLFGTGGVLALLGGLLLAAGYRRKKEQDSFQRN